MTDWNPNLYLQFRDERTQPALDLLARIALTDPRTGVDLGCGPGNSTQPLRARWPQARITGIDSSPHMIEMARASYPQESWLLADAGQWSPAERYDLVFSNATLQWIPDHGMLIPRLFAAVKPGGALAVQVPANQDSPLHQALLRVSALPAWDSRTSDCRAMIEYRTPDYYYDLLAPLAGRVDLWQTTYLHVMDRPSALIDWYASTGMKPYLERLNSDEERSQFQQAVLQACEAQYPLRKDGRILFAFTRTFFIAYAA
jgi:trans-aconitate 2-methyltransferase